MGGLDKAALLVGNVTLLDRVLTAAEPLCSPLVVVGPVRATIVPHVSFTMEKGPGGGPVPAVLAGLGETAGAETVFVLAADLAMLSTASLEQLLVAFRNSGAGAAAAPDGNGKPNPLLAVYRTSAIRHAVRQLGPDISGIPAARLLPQDTVVVGVDAHESINVNTPADLALAISADRERRS